MFAAIELSRDAAVNPWAHSLPMPSEPVKFKPRVIRIQLESETAIISDNEMTWDLRFPSFSEVAEGSTLVWESLFVAGTGAAANTTMEFSLSGLNVLNINTRNARSQFSIRAVCRSSDGVFDLLMNGRCPQATLLDRSLLRSARVTLSKTAGNPFSAQTVLRLGLLVLEPGCTIA